MILKGHFQPNVLYSVKYGAAEDGLGFAPCKSHNPGGSFFKYMASC